MDLVERTSTLPLLHFEIPALTPTPRSTELAKQASQISIYDIKSYYNQAKNAVLNVSEMEAKVREATNDDSWSVGRKGLSVVCGTPNADLH